MPREKRPHMNRTIRRFHVGGGGGAAGALDTPQEREKQITPKPETRYAEERY